MELSGQLVSYLYQYFDNAAFLALSAAGLILIYGMMGVINMAHGELMMIGAYVATYAFYAGVPVPAAILLAGVVTGLVGILLERLIVRHFYNQLLSSLVVTWGLSLILSQGVLLLMGPSTMNMPTPFGSFDVGEFSFGIFRMVLFGIAVLLIVGLWALFRFTSFGNKAQAAIENPAMAEALGIDTRRIYTLTFGLGSAVGGIAGGMFAMTAAVSPFFGQSYTPLAFITVVIGGGANAIAGLVYGVAYLAGVQTIASNVFNQYVGYISIMAAAFVVLLLMPAGISAYTERRRIRSTQR
jgi:branched-chain amino acid transport system permease protein